MVKRGFLAASTVLAFALVAPAGPFSPGADTLAQAPKVEGAAPATQQTPAPMQNTAQMHERMMAEMKAADAKLDALVAAMNTATGDAKVGAVAAVVTELVAQHKAMQGHMGQMMGGRGMMMQK